MYTRFYGLFLKPFENTPDSRFLFPAKSHREVLASMRYGVDNSKGFVLISGDIGTGKTTMINALLKHIDPSYIIFNILNPKWTFDQIIQYLATKLEIIVKDQDTFQILENLKTKLEKINFLGKRVVLIIDEAHLLSESTLENIRLLSNIEKEDKKLIQIILVGQKEIYQTLQKNSLRTLKQRIVINRNLEPLSKKETNYYIRHRLRIAGRKSKLFNDRALVSIWQRSQGIPRIINHICDNALLIGYVGEVKLIGPKVIKEVIADMDYGMKKEKVTLSFYTEIFKWAGAAILLLILLGFVARYFFLNPASSKYAVSEENQISVDQTEESLFKRSIDEINMQNASSNKTEDVSEVNITAEDKPIEQKTESELNESTINVAKNMASVPSRPQHDVPVPNITSKLQKNPEKRKHQIQKIVRPKENLKKIAKDAYGVSHDTIVDFIHMANSDIKDVNRIFIGQRINLPEIKKDDLIVAGENGNYHIHYASFYNPYGAKLCVQELAGKKEKGFIIPTYQQETKVYRVYYGLFENRSDAKKELNALTLKYVSFVE